MPVYSNKTYLDLMRPLPRFVNRDTYDIPFIEPVPIDISSINNGLWLINMKNVSPKDKRPEKKIVHSFCYDDVLRRAYKNPAKYLARVSKYFAVSSFDFSMDIKMDFKQMLSAVYDNRWSGAYMQANGKLVIPTVGWVAKDSFDLCFAGLKDGGVFLISTLGANNPESLAIFLEGYSEMRRRFPNTKIICVGDPIQGMDYDVCFVKYEESFGSWDRHHDYWQPKLINWDGTIPERSII